MNNLSVPTVASTNFGTVTRATPTRSGASSGGCGADCEAGELGDRWIGMWLGPGARCDTGIGVALFAWCFCYICLLCWLLLLFFLGFVFCSFSSVS